MKIKLTIGDIIRIKIRDFFRKRTWLEITRTTETNEPVVAVWFWGLLMMRKKYSFIMNKWVDLGKDESFEV